MFLTIFCYGKFLDLYLRTNRSKIMNYEVVYAIACYFTFFSLLPAKYKQKSILRQ